MKEEVKSELTATLCFLGGALAGGITALLLAPMSGKSLRNKICNKAKDCVEHVEEEIDEARRRVSEAVHRGGR